MKIIPLKIYHNLYYKIGTTYFYYYHVTWDNNLRKYNIWGGPEENKYEFNCGYTTYDHIRKYIDSGYYKIIK